MRARPAPLSQTGSLQLTVNGPASPSACGNMSLGNGASLNGYVPFPASNAWNTNIAAAAIDPNSATIISVLTGSHLHPDFSNVVDGNYGIPYVVVDSSATARRAHHHEPFSKRERYYPLPHPHYCAH